VKPKLLVNLILLAVLAALAGVAFLEPGKQEPKAIRLLDIDPDKVSRFELHNTESLVFEKQNGHWRLAAPFAAPANEIRVRQLLSTARVESRAHYPLNPDELAKFGLDKPKAVLTVGDTRLIFGGYEPIDMLRYVQIGSTLHLVGDDFAHHLNAQATDYVDKKLLPEEVTLTELSLPGLTAKRGEKGRWNLEPTGDGSAMDDLINAWLSARAIEVKRNEAIPQGDPIHIKLSNGQAVEFIITQREPDLLLVRPDWKLEYLVTGEAAKRLLGLQKPLSESDKQQDEESSEAPLEASPEEAVDFDPDEDAEKKPE
jgi:hypothetical protein